MIRIALEEAIKWAVPGALTALSVWWLATRSTVRAWRKRRAERKAKFEAMITGFGSLQGQVEGIAKQVRPNGGGSLMDAVTRIETSTKEHGCAINEVRAAVRAQADLSDDGGFQCDPAGRNTWVNVAYARLLGVGKADLMGMAWKNFIHPDDAGIFLAANAAAITDHRPFSGRCRMVRSDGELVQVDVTIYPDPERPPAQRWFGKIREVSEP